MDPQKITELANLLRQSGDKILSSEFKLTLSGSLLRALNDSFTLIADSTEIGETQTFQVVKPINSKSPVFRDLQLIHDFVQKTALLCIVHYPTEDYFEGTIDISKFRTLKRLEVQKTNVLQITGIQALRSQLQELICIKSLKSVDDIITNCGGDNSNGFVWNELKMADFSFNNLQKVDTSLEFAQYLQHLNLRHNNLQSVEAIKWLPYLKTLDLSFNRLQYVPQFHAEAHKRLQTLNMSNNLVENLIGINNLDALTDLDLSDNFLLEHTYLLPLSALMTLKFLNLYGNPLHCHPKHRLATAQFLHENCANTKFVLDFEPLSKKEKDITGTHRMRNSAHSLNRYSSKSTSSVISSRSRLTPSTQTPASSIGSLRSFSLDESSTDTENSIVVNQSTTKRVTKVRTVDFDEVMSPDNSRNSNKTNAEVDAVNQNDNKKSFIMEASTEHLETKEQIKILREKYGTEWLQASNDEMMNSVLGINTTDDTRSNQSQQIYKDFLGELSETLENVSTNTELQKSTPRDASPSNESILNTTIAGTNINDSLETSNNIDNTHYMSIDSDSLTNTSNGNQTFYQSFNETNASTTTASTNESESNPPALYAEENVKDARLSNVYSSTLDTEPEISEPEDDEETYIVYKLNHKEAIFLTISSNFLREKDTLTQRTKTKWSLKILESCDRIKSNTLRINFDTVKLDKQERIYTVEDGLCRELEKKLRDILSKRDLTEMNQTLYRCVSCSCQFSRENKYHKNINQDVRCPDCKSTFVAELHELPRSLEKSNINDLNISPAATVEESTIMTPLIIRPFEKIIPQHAEETNSIGKGPSRLTANNAQKSRNLMQSLKSSANSLNESSSCSKISNSQSSFDSNQSVVGSSNTERENDFKSNCESDVDILSNPSQSSIEVLDQTSNASRKTSSEERRPLQLPSLETIDDAHTNEPVIMVSETNNAENSMQKSATKMEETDYNTETQQTPAKSKTKSSTTVQLAHFNLTESSSSGSVTDSVCTAYEQQQQLADKTLMAEDLVHSAEKIVIHNFLAEESGSAALPNSHTNANKFNNNNNSEKSKVINGALKKEESGISSVFGALFQSTNILMSSSKKTINAEPVGNIQTGTVLTPSSPTKCYKFNYTDFNDVDHRLKLYFYQTKFEANGEHFKWLARGRIYNENTQTLFDGLIVMSTMKCYLMEAYAAEHDDVSKWLRQVFSVTVDRLENIQLLPWKIGLTFSIRDWGSFLLLLQDILRTDSLLLFFTNNALPAQCELNYQISDEITNRLNAAAMGEKLKMCSILNGCEVSCDNAKRNFKICALLTTDTKLYLTSSKFSWLSLAKSNVNIDDHDIELCVTQLMSNLVHVEFNDDYVFTINFLDETQNKCELWKCTFETKENAKSCLNAIGQSWGLLFGVPLCSR